MADPPAADLTRAAVLFARHGDFVHERLLRRYRGADPDLVADALTDAVLAASADPDFPDADHPDCPHRLAKAARDKLRTRFRGNARRRKREEKYATAVTARRSAAPSPADEAEARELAAGLRDRIARTPEELAVFDLWMTGVSDPAEIGERLGTPASDAATLLARFRQRIHREKARQEDAP